MEQHVRVGTKDPASRRHVRRLSHESALILQKRYTLFLRAERIDAHDLLHDMPNIDPVLSHASFPVLKLSVGGIYDIPLVDHLKFGIGGLVSKYGVPAGLT